MAAAVLFDTVTLSHFAVAGRLDLCEAYCTVKPDPRWTQAVHDEVTAGSDAGVTHCDDILAARWLGEPAVPDPEELLDIYRVQIGLNGGLQPPTAHAGEAESIYLAEKCGGIFATDDNGAYDFAVNRPNLGPGRVVDTVRILQELVSNGEIAVAEAVQVARAIADAGRDLRKCHPAYPDAKYFDP